MSEPFRVLITGSRSWTDAQAVHGALLDVWHDAIGQGRSIVVVHGGARGADAIAGQWAAANGVPVEVHQADWSTCAPTCPRHRQRWTDGQEYCPSAGLRRNQVMVDAGADVVLAFQAANSPGTEDCIRRAIRAGIEVRRFPDA